MEKDNLNDTNLYNIAMRSIIKDFNFFVCKIGTLPDTVLLDVLYECSLSSKIELLCNCFDVGLFCRVLRLRKRWMLLLTCVQKMISSNLSVMKNIVANYAYLGVTVYRCDYHRINEIVDFGIAMGEFLNDGAWLDDAECVLTHCHNLCVLLPKTVESLMRAYNCCYRLFHTQVRYYKYNEADTTYTTIERIVCELHGLKVYPNLSCVYAEYCRYQYMRSNYNEAYAFGQKAVLCIDNNTPSEVKIDVLRHAAKACVVKRKLFKAKVLIHKALWEAQIYCKHAHYKYGHVLADYGFYLLNSDATKYGAMMYQWSLRIFHETFGRTGNLNLAIAEEDLAYSLYVSEYSSGYFHRAMAYAKSSVNTMKYLLPAGHLMLCSANRVKALILEEMALDSMQLQTAYVNQEMLEEAEILHKEALMATQRLLGTDNILTAKHYGNLGRLYQTMRRFQESKEMHLKAIAIKERLLGENDYEVALSVGHLASLYNYHMADYGKAEYLYMRSIYISLNVFGPSFSGLEYDYRGLVHVYSRLGDSDGAIRYMRELTEWKNLRVRNCNRESLRDLVGMESYTMDMVKDIYTDKLTVDDGELF